VERVRHSPGRGPQALESEPRRLSGSLPQLVEWKTETGIKPSTDDHDRQYAARLEAWAGVGNARVLGTADSDQGLVCPGGASRPAAPTIW
jgi:hypothetical protein